MNRKPYIPIKILLLMEKNKSFTFTIKTEKPPKQEERKKKNRPPVQIREITTGPPPMLIITTEIVPVGQWVHFSEY